MTELLAPVGSHEALAAALQAGADSVYFGISGLNMRTGGRADFTLEELPSIVENIHAANAKAYLTLNVVTYDGEQDNIDATLLAAKNAKVDAIICWDFAVIKKCEAIGIPIHISTQASISNYEALKFYTSLGAKTVVLARELTLEQIKNIIAQRDEDGLDVKIETFIHGAMCIAVSGRCFMSQIAQCKSANRGECLQMCRRSYIIKDEEEGTEFKLENNFVMSPKDLCALPVIDAILDAKIDVLKIEGRMRSPEYVKVVVESYKEAIAAHEQGTLDDALKERLLERMASVYNKGFSTGFYNGIPIDEWSGVYGNKATKKKMKVGKVTNYYEKIGVVEIQLASGIAKKSDEFYIIGPTTGVIEGKLPELMMDDVVLEAKKGDVFTFKCAKARVNDVFYLVK